MSKVLDEIINNENRKKNNNYNENRDYLNTYYDIGKLIVEECGMESNSKIKDYYNELNIDLKKKYSLFNLRNMCKFYLMCKGGMELTSLLTWSHYVELLKLNSIDEVNNYISIAVNKHLSVRQLRLKIKIYRIINK